MSRSTAISRVATLAAADRPAACLVALAHLYGIGQATLRRCHLEHGAVETWVDIVSGRPDRVVPLMDVAGRDPKALQAIVAKARERDPEADLLRQLGDGRRVHVHGTRGYPERLLADQAAPAVLYSQGDLSLLSGPTAAVVGTRNATLAGRQWAEELGASLGRAGVAVVSGLALGIDGAAHRGAVEARDDPGGGPEAGGEVEPSSTVPAVGVIAAGLNVAYPRRHAHLHHLLARRGLLLSETPAGVKADPWRFPARNRIIAALADILVVVESRVTGGSMLTVEEALARDVPILAVPGHPSAPASAGTNALIFDGAGMARSAADVLMAMGIDAPGPLDSSVDEVQLSPAQTAVLSALAANPASLAELVVATGRSLDEVALALADLANRGMVGQTSGWYEATGRQAASR